MKRLLMAALLCGFAASAHAQCLPVPNGDTRSLVLGVFDGHPFTQQTLEDAMPFLHGYGIALTPPNAVGDKTKVGDPVSGRWTRVGFGEGHPVWVPQGDIYVIDTSLCTGVTPTPPPPVSSDDLGALLSLMGQMQQQMTSLRAYIEEQALQLHMEHIQAAQQAGTIEHKTGNKWLDLAVTLAGIVSTYLVTK